MTQLKVEIGQSITRFNASDNPRRILSLPGEFMGMAATAQRLLQEGQVKSDIVMSQTDPLLGYVFDPASKLMVEVSVMQGPDGSTAFREHKDGMGNLVPCKGYKDVWVNEKGVQTRDRHYCSPHLAFLMSLGVEIQVKNDPRFMHRLTRQMEYAELEPGQRLNFDFRE